MMRRVQGPVRIGSVVRLLWLSFSFGIVGGLAAAEPPAMLLEVPAVPMTEVGGEPTRAAIPPRNTGPAARAHSRYRRGRHGTTRIIRRTPEVMREDAARVKRGDLFSTWSNEYIE